MCDLISAIGLAISAAQSVMQYQGEVQAAEEQNQLYRENAANSNANALQQGFANNLRQEQENTSLAADKIDAMKQGRAAKATAAARAGEAGVSGNSVDGLLNSLDGQQASYVDRLTQQNEWNVTQLQQEKKQIYAQNQDQINGVQRAATPSFAATGLAIAGNAFTSIANFKQQNPGKPLFGSAKRSA